MNHHNNQKIKYLDGLRGLAALVVVFNHFAYAFYPAVFSGNFNEIHTRNALEISFAKSPLNIIYNGNFAVCIFFILSGYVLSVKYFSTNKKEFILRSIITRYFRLIIPVIVSLLIIYVLLQASLLDNKAAGNLSSSTWWLASYSQTKPDLLDILKEGIYRIFVAPKANYNPVLWTMYYEFWGAALIFSLINFVGKYKFRWVIYFILAISLINTYYLGFILGYVLSDVSYNKRNILKLFSNTYLKVIFMILGLFLGSFPPGINTNNSIYQILNTNLLSNYISFYHIIGAFLIMIVLLTSTNLQKFLAKKEIHFLGKLSFSVYLVHMAILLSFSSWIFIILNSKMSYLPSVLLSLGFSLIITILLSTILYKYIDQTSIKLSKQINKFVTNFKPFKSIQSRI